MRHDKVSEEIFLFIFRFPELCTHYSKKVGNKRKNPRMYCQCEVANLKQEKVEVESNLVMLEMSIAAVILQLWRRRMLISLNYYLNKESIQGSNLLPR